MQITDPIKILKKVFMVKMVLKNCIKKFSIILLSLTSSEKDQNNWIGQTESTS